MPDISDLLRGADHSSPLRLSYVAHVLEGIEDSVLLEYAKQNVITNLNNLGSLVIIDAFIKELKKRKRDEVTGIHTLIKRGRPIKEIVEQSAVILSGAIPGSEYKRLVKRAEKNILADLRAEQLKIVRRRYAPFKAYSSIQFYARLAVAGVVLFAAFLGVTLSRYWKYGELIEYGKQHQTYLEEVKRSKTVEDMLAEARKGRKFEGYKSIKLDQKKEEELDTIKQVSVSGSDKALRKEMIDLKLKRFDKFIEENKDNPIAILAEYLKGEIIAEEHEIYDASKGIELMTSALQKGVDCDGIVYSTSPMFIALEIYRHAERNEKDKGQALKFLKDFAEEHAGTCIGDHVCEALAGIYSKDKKIFEDNELVEVNKRFPVSLDNALFNGATSREESNRFYRILISKTKDIDRYYAAQYMLATNILNSGDDLNIDVKHDIIGRFLSVAAVTSDKKLKMMSLLEVGKLYQSMKMYGRGNMVLKYILDNTEANEEFGDIRNGASYGIVSESYTTFMDNLFE
jgi:hypothetical protein